MSKRKPLDAFFKPTESKKQRVKVSEENASKHKTYPYPVPQLPDSIKDALGFCPATDGKEINDQPDLDLLYFQPYVVKDIERALFEFLRQELFFYRVQYKIKRGPVETQINTPRYTTVFGVDETSIFSEDGSLLDKSTKKPIPKDRYKCTPRPLPGCLDYLRTITEASTNETYNFCLVNYYANGSDSISYHSDDERFLGGNPAIASFSLGARRDFLMKHKPVPPSSTEPPPPEAKPLKLPLASGDMILMRGPTQSNWLHSIPKRKGGESERGRINITFRKAMVRGGTENYYQYNVGNGQPFRWDDVKKEMVPWSGVAEVDVSA
ncbi:DNA repair family protein [Saccharata proteae CBS 121410]|uniref:DNA repair family protein n=1 Tax=Saccharata proteae CBS 121410 TaxID=1314787 RepID=A0A9P4HWW9_9PEZI|nr:DNA repair family protein [Saccharata proteae CBS 121410]